MMSSIAAGWITLLAAYFVGSLPFGYLVARSSAGLDIRKAGSGNIGATNVARLLGAKLGLFVLVLDCLKGLLPVWLLPNLFRLLAEGNPETAHLQVGSGVAAIVGHIFPCWLRFRGGKGVATSLGVVIVLSWPATLSALVVFLLVFALSRLVALASMLAAVGFAVSHLLFQTAPFSEPNWSLSAFSLAVPLLIILRHRTNLSQIFRGDEPRFRAGDPTARSQPPLAEQDDRDGTAEPNRL